MEKKYFDEVESEVKMTLSNVLTTAIRIRLYSPLCFFTYNKKRQIKKKKEEIKKKTMNEKTDRRGIE